jgi:hypothetical protein
VPATAAAADLASRKPSSSLTIQQVSKKKN